MRETMLKTAVFSIFSLLFLFLRCRNRAHVHYYCTRHGRHHHHHHHHHGKHHHHHHRGDGRPPPPSVQPRRRPHAQRTVVASKQVKFVKIRIQNSSVTFCGNCLGTNFKKGNSYNGEYFLRDIVTKFEICFIIRSVACPRRPRWTAASASATRA